MKKLFLAISILLVIYVKNIETNCFTQPPAGFTSDQFYASPQNVTIEACDISNENSCCTNELSRTISQYTDSWTSSFLSQFSYTTTTCKGAIQGLSCLLCSADQQSFTSLHGSQFQYFLCSSYCTELLSACTNSRLTNSSFVSIYGDDSVSFCFKVFEGVSNLGVSLVVSNADDFCWNDEPVCDEDSYYYEYTQCVGGSRSKVWQKKPEVVCSGGLPLPSAETGLPCALSCAMGQMATQNGCANCNVGKYSLGSAIREDAWASWDSLSIPFQTYCTYQDFYRNEHVVTDAPCGWTLTGGFEINSGALNNSQSSYLETSVVLIDDGALAFDYKVDAEPRFDGLIVYVDRQIVLPKVSNQLDFTLQIINLTAGYHFIQFVYSKDSSIAEGLDQATLNLVQLSPVNFASDECLNCRAGRYQNQTGKSFCYDCPANTYSAAGSFRCTKCPPNYYSYSGSSSCTPQTPCTTDDVYYLYGECYYNNDQELVQDQYPVWNAPHTCNDYGNPTPNYPNITNPCSQCNAGQYRSGTTCEFCDDGYYSSGTTDDCQLCTAGSAAAKILLLDHFDAFTDYLTTDCSYFCGSPGWELHDEYIDSGSGHGRYVNSNLHLSTTLISDGYFQFKFTLVCASACSFTFSLSGTTGGSYTGGPNSIYQTVNQTVLRDLPAGDNSIVFTFTKNDPDNIVGRNDYARIEYIYVSNVQEGGAEKCDLCPTGHYSSSDASSVCQKCPVGTYANVVGSTDCIPCEDGYFNTDEGQTSCIACGEGSHSTPDRTGCIVTCTFLDTSMIDYSGDEGEDNSNNNGVYYDLTPLGRTDDEMYGPVYDTSNQAYFLNLCVKEHNNNTCINEAGDPVYTYACQVTVIGIGMDLGNIFGILPLRHEEEYEGELEREGVTVHLTNGATCLNTTTGQRFPRQTYIDVICDPNSGIGAPYPMLNNLTVETSKCVYDFKWYSLYGCHVCNEDDYTYIITACDNNQKRYIQYLWIDNPKRCHSGVSLPDTQELSCVNTDATHCPPGQYLDLSISQPTCTDADPGFYSIGGGNLYKDWSSLPEGFSSISWTSVDEGGAIRSGFGDTSFFYLHDFVEVGEVSITFKIFGYQNINEGFTVSLDNDPVFDSITSTNGVWNTIKIDNIAVGHRFITFEFKGGFVSTKKDEDIGVMISTIKVLGTSHAAEYQIACDEGYYSVGGAEICTPCPANSFAANPSSDSCDPCPEGTYSFPGSSACSFQVPCTLGDYQKTFSICNEENNQREIIYLPLDPFVCDPSALELPIEDAVSCDVIACEPGEYRSSSSSFCATCQVGYYWDEDKQSCSQSAPGYAGILLTGYYNHEEIILPEAFSTGCSGAHCSSTSNGWRSRSTYLDSGYNGAYSIDVYLDLDVDLTFDGSISFQYSVKGDKSVGVYFFIDEKQQSLSYHPSSSSSRSNSNPSFNLSSGKHTIRWVYHQDEDSTGNANITNIIVTGAGGATSQTECPVGTYSNSFGSNQCIPCAVGTFSSNVAATSCSACADQTFASEEASTHCQSCGELTKSNPDHTDCYTDCIFAVTNGTVDLSPLSSFTSLYDINSISAKLWLNVCQKKTSSVYCIDPITGNSISTYSCQVDSNGSGIDSGNLLSVDVDDNSIVMTYSNGQTTDDCPNPISTEITFVCDPNDDESQPQVVNGSTECHLKLLWTIAFACPVCRAEDYVEKSTDCVNGEQTTANIRNSACYGLLVTDSVTSECSEPIHINIWIIIVVIVVFVILVVIVIGIIVWNRKLHSQYTALVQKGEGSYETSETPNTAAPTNESPSTNSE